MMKITGLDKLQAELKDAQKAFEGLDGELAIVSVDPNDPASIDAAIQQIDRAIDERVGHFADNSFVAPVADAMKAKYREAIIEKAATARLKAGDE